MTEESKSKRFSLFKKSQSVKRVEATEVQEPAFDETTFQFALTGGKYQTTLIQASATLKSGPNAGMPLPLQCTWYRANSDVDFQQIEGVTGAFYQPSADDVGCKINVHAVPVSEVEDYTGMPAFAEVGPLMLDPKIQKDVDEMIRSNSASFLLKVLSAEGLLLPRPPSQLQITIDKSTLRLSLSHEDLATVPISPGFPQVRMSPYPSTDLEISLSTEVQLSCQEESSEIRDLIAVTLRAFAGMNLGEGGAGGSSDSLLRIQQLSEALTKAAREREVANTQISIAKDRESELKKDRDELKKELDDTKRSFETEISSLTNRFRAETSEKDRKISTLTQERQKLIDQMDLTSQQCNFLRQDIGIYKSQIAEMEHKSESTLVKLNALKLVHMALREKVTELKGKKSVHGEAWEQIVEMVSAQGDSSETPQHSSKPSSIKSGKTPEDPPGDSPPLISELQSSLSQLRLDLSKSQADLAAAQEQVLRVEGERNFFRKKCESLTRENEHLMTQLGRNPKEISEFERQKEVFAVEKQKCTEELTKAREQSSLYRTAMEVTQRKLEEEIHRNTEMRQHLKHSTVKAGPEAFQSIIASLTETLTDRELALEGQKDINRSLMNRVTELEAIVLSVSQRM